MDQKRKIAPLIVDAILAGDPNLKRDQVTVVFRDLKKTDRAQGGIFDSDR